MGDFSMIISGQTSLDRAGVLPAATLEQLRGLWIESVEELVSVAAALDAHQRGVLSGALGGDVPDLPGLSSRFIDPRRLEGLTRAQPGGGLGCYVDPAVLRAFEESGEVTPGRGARRAALAGEYPAAVRLMDRMYPVKDQGARGTCVAFASVALREYLNQRQEQFSEQFLYWACKELDGSPGPGTWVHTAISALAEYGVCRANMWPYNPSQNDDNEAQGPPPPGAEQDAARYRMRYARTVEPGVVEHYKRVLVGDGATPGMPVAFATLVFYSWYASAETHRTGKITMPLPGEQPLPGGHAWCVAGYVDSPAAPGGGYFIVRNSWGAHWAPDSPEAAGHALMPYAYVARYALEAYTGAMVDQPAARDARDDDFAPYVMNLKQNHPDIHDALLTAGSKVLANPDAPDRMMMDTPANRRQFRAQDFTWDPQTRSRRYFPPVAALARPVRDEIDRLTELKQGFLGTLDRNLDLAKKQPLPDRNLPPWLYLIPWEPRVAEVAKEDISAYLCAAVRKRANVPDEVAWPEEWERVLAQTNHASVYTLGGAGVQVHVVVSFLSPLLCRPGESPETVLPAPDTLQTIEQAYAAWREKTGARAALFVYHAVGVGGPFRVSPDALSDSGSIKAVAYPVARDQSGHVWKFQIPSRFEERPRLARFLSRLKPETLEQRATRIDRRIRRMLDGGFAGHLTAVKLAAETGYSLAETVDAYLLLEQQGEYGLYETEKKMLAIERLRPQQQQKQRRARLSKNWLQRHLLLILSPPISVALWMIKDAILGRPFTLRGFLVALPMAYIGALIDRYLLRFREPKE